MDIDSAPTLAGISIVFIAVTLHMSVDPVPLALGIYYTVFLDAVIMTITDLAFKGEPGPGPAILLGSWLGVATSGVNPIQALTGPFTWFLGPHAILPPLLLP